MRRITKQTNAMQSPTATAGRAGLSRRQVMSASAAALAVAALPKLTFAAAPSFVTIGTASANSSVYPVGVAFAQIINRNFEGTRASATTTGGSVDNINLLESGEIEFGFSQAGVVYDAVHGHGVFDGRASGKLRGVMSTQNQIVHLVARSGSGIETVSDLRGKRFIPGAAGSGAATISRQILEQYGLDFSDSSVMSTQFLDQGEAIEMLKNGQVDAAVFTGSMPLASVIDIATSGDVRIISIEEEVINNMVEAYPWFYGSSIRPGTYRNQDQEVRVLALSTLLLTNAEVSPDFIYDLLKVSFENIDALHASHAAVAGLAPDNATIGMTVELHEGAQKFFEEMGIL